MFKVLAMIIAMATGHVAKAAPVEVSYDAVLAPVLSTTKLHGGDHCDGRGHSDDHGRGNGHGHVIMHGNHFVTRFGWQFGRPNA
jgi:hypothetical protein